MSQKARMSFTDPETQQSMGVDFEVLEGDLLDAKL